MRKRFFWKLKQREIPLGERTVLLESEIKLKGFKDPIVLHEGWTGAQARQAIPSYIAVVVMLSRRW